MPLRLTPDYPYPPSPEALADALLARQELIERMTTEMAQFLKETSSTPLLASLFLYESDLRDLATRLVEAEEEFQSSRTIETAVAEFKGRA